jgi:hypothetical protein
MVTNDVLCIDLEAVLVYFGCAPCCMNNTALTDIRSHAHALNKSKFFVNIQIESLYKIM